MTTCNRLARTNKLILDVEINYPKTIIGNDEFSYIHSQEAFIKQICRARTFAFSEDIQKMRAAGLAIGGSLNNAIVVDKFKIVNSSGLRLDKEFAKQVKDIANVALDFAESELFKQIQNGVPTSICRLL